MKAVILLMLLIACTYDPNSVRYVIDGDTFVLNNGETIRLQGMDTPEQGDDNYDKAAYELQKRIIGKKLTLEGTTDDIYGRKIRFVFADGNNVNVEMVREGWARALMHTGTKYELQIEEAQKMARQEKTGIWNINDESYRRMSHRCVQLGCPDGTITVASKEGSVYYNCACSSAGLIKKENLECYTSIEDAISLRGYSASRRC